MTRRNVVALGCVITLLAVLLPLTTLRGQGVFSKAREKANITKCGNNLRNVTLGAMQYAEDKRYYPHVSSRQKLDGDVDTNHTPRVARALLWYDYFESPLDFICPSSADGAAPITDPETQENMRLWSWGGKQNRAAGSPLVAGRDPTLSRTWELSYGYMRKARTRNVRSRVLVAADRANVVEGGEQDAPLGGNHDDGWNVVMADAAVDYYTTDYDPGLRPQGPKGAVWLTSTDKGGAALAIRPAGYKAKAVPKPPWLAKKKKTDADEGEVKTDAGGCGQSCRLSAPSSFKGAGQGLALALLVLGLLIVRWR